MGSTTRAPRAYHVPRTSFPGDVTNAGGASQAALACVTRNEPEFHLPRPLDGALDLELPDSVKLLHFHGTPPEAYSVGIKWLHPY